IEIQGVRFQFVFHNQQRFFGAENSWIDSYNKVKCSSLEKTLVDSFINPQYSGGIIEISKAVYESNESINRDKLIDYFVRAGSKVAARRYVFICDLLEIGDSHHENLLQSNISESVSLLDPSVPDEGKINSRYKLKINRDINTIKQYIFT